MTALLAALRDRTRADDPRAVTVDGHRLSRAELRSAAQSFAASLDTRGPVAICATPTLETVVAVTGCLLAGITAVPVPPDAGAAEIAHILADSAATAWVGEPREHVDLPVRRVTPDTGSVPAQEAETDDDHIAMILYTSGTTGAPKGVLLSRAAIAAGIDALAEAWDWTDRDTVAHGLPLFHTHGLILGILGSLHIGSRVVHTGKAVPERYAATPATMYFGVPTVWGRIAADEASARALADARLLVSGSAPLPLPVFERLRVLTGHAPIERYGMTETMITLSTRADGERRPGWVGSAVDGVDTRLRGEDGAEVPADGESVGRLEVRGPMLFAGYLGRPDATAASWTEDGWFITGDVAVKDSAGFHRIVGRESVDLIKSGGYRIGAGEIETSLLARPEVREVAVVGEPDADLGQRIVAYVAATPGSDADAEALVAHVAGELSWHKRPREIRFVDALPRNAMGKVQKAALIRGDGPAADAAGHTGAMDPLPVDLPPGADHRAAEAAFAAAGWERCGAGDWAVALASPDGALVARISPFDPVGPYSAALYREAAGTGQVPVLHAHRRLAGGGDLQVMERLAEAPQGAAEAFHRSIAAGTEEVAELAAVVGRVHENALRDLPWCGPLDTNPSNVMLRADGSPVLIDPYYADGPDLFATAGRDPDLFVTRIPEDQRRFLTEIPLAASGPWPEAEREAMRAALAAADARSEKMDR